MQFSVFALVICSLRSDWFFCKNPSEKSTFQFQCNPTEEITKQMIDEYPDEILDSDDGLIFWFTLADTQWNLGRLMPDVRDRALELLDNGGDLARWREEDPKLAIVMKLHT
jgi:hypothetical protein